MGDAQRSRYDEVSPAAASQRHEQTVNSFGSSSFVSQRLLDTSGVESKFNVVLSYCRVNLWYNRLFESPAYGLITTVSLHL